MPSFVPAVRAIVSRPNDAAATYRDVVRVVCSPIPDRTYKPAIAVQADGEVLGASCATIEMAGLERVSLSATESHMALSSANSGLNS